MKQHNLDTQFVVCIKNEGYPASLEVRKIYQVIPDDRATERQLIRMIDESGEDYLYPVDYFVPIELPKAVEKVFSIHPATSKRLRPFGLCAGEFTVPDDFDEPLPENIIQEFEGS